MIDKKIAINILIKSDKNAKLMYIAQMLCGQILFKKKEYELLDIKNLKVSVEEKQS